MFKIKLSILFLISISFIGCLTSRVSDKQLMSQALQMIAIFYMKIH